MVSNIADKANINYFENKCFGRHESFHLRTGWLRKGFKNIKLLNSDNSIEELGVGKNMVNAIRYWCQAFRIIESTSKGYQITEFARDLFVNDCFLEDPFSDWLLHYQLATNYELAPSFFWAFNYLSLKEFNSDSFVKSFVVMLERLGQKNLNSNTLASDFHVLTSTYCDKASEKRFDEISDSPFLSLNLMAPINDNRSFRFKIGPKVDLPPELIAYAIAKQIQYKQNTDQPLSSFQINLDSLLWEPFSPGMIFKIDGETLVEYLDAISTQKLLGQSQFSTSAGIKQLIVTCNKKLDPQNLINDFRNKKATTI